MEVLGVILLIISAIIGIIVVNFGYKLYMQIMCIDEMYYNPKKKLSYIIIVSGAIWLLLLKLFTGV